MYLNIPMFNAALIVLVYTYTTQMHKRYGTYPRLLNALCVPSRISPFLIRLER